MKRININKITNVSIRKLINNVMKKYNIKRMQINILTGENRIPEIRFLKKELDMEGFYWSRIISSYYAATTDLEEYKLLGELWREFFDDIDKFSNSDECVVIFK